MSNQNIRDVLTNLLNSEKASEKTKKVIFDYVRLVEGKEYKFEKINNFWKTLTSLMRVWKNYRLDKKLEKICLFIGFPRSGHTLVSCLIDAHPNIILSNEEDILWLVENGYTKKPVYYNIVNNARREAKEGRQISGYQFYVPHQWNGKIENLKVIGDKHGPLTVTRLIINKNLLTEIENYFKLPVKYIQVIRNPYDNIQTIAKKDFGGIELQVAAELYFILCKGIDIIIQEIDMNNILFVRHEEIIKNLKVVLKEIWSFLEVDVSQKYLQDCARIVYKIPHKSRFEGNWTPELINWVAKKIKKYEFLSGYYYYD